MKRQVKHILTLVVGLATLVALFGGPSCSPGQLQTADRVFADANAAGRITTQIIQSPEGALIPEPIRSILAGLGLAGAAAIAVWQRIRASKILERSTNVTATHQAVVDAIDAKPTESTPIKAEIKQVMKDREIYSTANAIVDELRSKAGG